jgi:hypothetical protein
MNTNKNGGVPATAPGGNGARPTTGSTSAGKYGVEAQRTLPAGLGPTDGGSKKSHPLKPGKPTDITPMK